jgi:hypothetical protein
MSRIACCRLVLFVTLSVAVVQPCFAQNQANDANVQRVTVSGTVVNSETSEPIPGALVEMMRFAMLTDDRGQFRFDGVPAMIAQISATKPGYFGPEDVGSWNPQLLDIANGMGPVTVKLVPEGIIFGQVLSTDGVPLDRIPIQLFRPVIQEGARRWETRGAITDDEGHFRIAELLPGSYYVVAGPSRDIGVQVDAVTATKAQGYGMAFYPSSPDMTWATPIIITPGKRMQIDFALSRAPFYRISGTVTGANPINLMVQLWSADGTALGGLQVNRQTGAFQSIGIPPGSYTLRAQVPVGVSSNRPNARDWRIAQLVLNVNSDITNLHLVVAQAPAIQVNCRVVSASPQPQGEDYQPIALRFLQVDQTGIVNFGFGPRLELEGPQDQPRLVIRGGEPGRYSIEFDPNGDFYVASATFGNTDLLREDLVIGDEPPAGAIELVLHDGPGRLNVNVTGVGAKNGATVFLVSDEFPNVIQAVGSVPNGDAQFWRLAPGSYHVFALDNASDLEYRRSGALDQFLSSASSVTIGENQRASVTVPVIHREN